MPYLAVVSTINGSVSKVLASTATYPYQVVKSRMQQRGASFEEHNKLLGGLTGTVDCVRRIYRYPPPHVNYWRSYRAHAMLTGRRDC